MHNELILSDENKEIIVAENHVDTQLDQDLVQARANMEDMAKIGMQAVAELASVASQSGDRVDYEKLAILMKAVSEVHKEFIQTSQSIDILHKPPEPEPTGGDTTNNILFTGSTAEMAEILKQLKG